VPERPLVNSNSNNREKTGAFHILYLGQFIPRKDGVTAIRALAGLSAHDWQFDAVGNGPDLWRWKKAAAVNGISDRVHFHPAVDNRLIGNLLDDADLLLLPSRYDGWGAVVNESLMCGVPVVCSDNCGAADLLREPWRGSVFKAGSVGNLRGILHGWIQAGKRSPESTARIRDWSSVLEGPPMARYLVRIVENIRHGGERPSPPWY